jgi:hypothetical protein
MRMDCCTESKISFVRAAAKLELHLSKTSVKSEKMKRGSGSSKVPTLLV